MSAPNLVQNIELLSRLNLSVSSALALNSTMVKVTASDFDGISGVYLEIVATNSNVSTAAVVTLEYSANGTSGWAAVDATYSKITIATYTDARTRARSGSFSLISGTNYYRINITTAAATVTLGQANIIIVQTAATKTASYVPLAHAPTNTATGSDTLYSNAASYLYNGGITSFQFMSGSGQSYFYYDSAAYASSLDSVLLQVTHNCGNASYAGNFRLYNITDSQAVVTGAQYTNTVVAVTELTVSGQSPWHSGDQYKVEHAAAGNTAADSHNLWNAQLVFKVSSLSKGEVYWRTVRYHSATAAFTNDYQRTKLEHSLYSTPVLYHEATGLCSSNTNNEIILNTHSTNDSGTTSPVNIDGYKWYSSTRARRRSGSITLPTDGYRLIAGKAATAAANTIHAAWAVVAFTGPADPKSASSDPFGMNGFYGV